MAKTVVAWNKDKTESVILGKLKSFMIVDKSHHYQSKTSAWEVTGWYNQDNNFTFGIFDSEDEARTFLESVHELASGTTRPRMSVPIAKACKRMQDLREQSWNSETGEYSLSELVCAIQACHEMKIDKDLAELIYLANHWSGDVARWAEEVVAKHEGRFPVVECLGDVKGGKS